MIRVVVPVYKCRRETAWEVSLAVADRRDAHGQLRVDLFETFPTVENAIRLEDLLHDAHVSGLPAAVARLTSQALLYGATVTGSESHLGSEQVVTALVTILDAVASGGVDVLVCPSWFMGTSRQGLVPALAARSRSRVIGVSVHESPSDPYTIESRETVDVLTRSAEQRLLVLNLRADTRASAEGESNLASGESAVPALSEIRRAVPQQALDQALEHLALQPYGDSLDRLDESVRESLATDLERFGFCAPFIPTELASGVEVQGPSQYGDADHPFSPKRNYLFRGVLADLAEGDWRPRIQLNYFGHGLNSYAWTYVLVTREVAIAGQVHAGGVYADSAAARRHWESLMTDAQVLRRQAMESDDRPTPRSLLLFVHNPKRSRSGWVDLQRFSSSTPELRNDADPLSKAPVLH